MVSSGILRRVALRSVRRLLEPASVVPSSPIIVTLRKEALSFSGTSVLTRGTRRYIPEDTILHSHCREKLKSYIFGQYLFWNLFYIITLLLGTYSLFLGLPPYSSAQFPLLLSNCRGLKTRRNE
jgi:hypothetical protein